MQILVFEVLECYRRGFSKASKCLSKVFGKCQSWSGLFVWFSSYSLRFLCLRWVVFKFSAYRTLLVVFSKVSETPMFWKTTLYLKYQHTLSKLLPFYVCWCFWSPQWESTFNTLHLMSLAGRAGLDLALRVDNAIHRKCANHSICCITLNTHSWQVILVVHSQLCPQVLKGIAWNK